MVKNVRPGALAGNLQPLHPDEPLGIADAHIGDDPGALGSADVTGVVVPVGDLDARIEWIGEAEDSVEAALRADAIWQHENAADPDVDKEALAERLRVAVYGTIATEVPAVEVQDSEPGEAVNADTGEVTQPGDPLPESEQDGGDPLPPASGDDSAPAFPEPTDDTNGAQAPDQGTDEGQNSTGSDDGGNPAP